MNAKKNSKKINIQELALQFKGTLFRELIQYHIDGMDEVTRFQAIGGHVDCLPEKLRSYSEAFVDRWLTKVLEPDFFDQDTDFVFTRVIEDARIFTQECDPSDEDLFYIFNILVMSYAINVRIHRTDFGEAIEESVLKKLYKPNVKNNHGD